MRSGLYGYTDAPELSQRAGCRPGEGLDAAGGPGDRVPATRRSSRPTPSYEYSNTNYALLGLVAEKVGGQPLARAVPGPVVRLRSASARRRFPPLDDTAIPDALLARLHVRRNRLRARRRAVPTLRCRPQLGPERCKPIDYTNQNSSYATRRGRCDLDGRRTWPRGSMAWCRARCSTPTSSSSGWTSLQAEDPDSARRAEVRIRNLLSAVQPDARRCTTTAASFRASTRSWATTRITM